MLARLLSPKDFGTVGMVTAFTGILFILRDFGLSSATVQRLTVTEEQTSVLFWINLAIGAALGLILLGAAPAVAAFYREPDLFWVTSVLAVVFLFNAAGVQHSALLQRQMRFTTLALISVVASTAGAGTAIGMAKAGCGYWALVAMSVIAPLIATIGFWLTSGWIPGRPRNVTQISSLMQFGGSLTLTSILVYIGYNAEKVLIGRVWGADAIGIYGRAYQIVSIPTENLNSAVGQVAFSALSRLQNDPGRFRNYFLKGFSLVLGLTLPLTITCALFADDLVFVILGPNWSEVVVLVRLLAPTIAIFAIINPLGWLVFSIGLVRRGLKAAPALACLMITGYVIGLPYGPRGVAFAYSAVLSIWVLPHIYWCIHGTMVSFGDVLSIVARTLGCGILAGALAFAFRFWWWQSISPLPRLFLESSVLVIVFFTALLFCAGQKTLYFDLVKTLKGNQSSASVTAS